MSQLDTLAAKVASNPDAQTRLTVLLVDLATMIDEAGTDPEKLRELSGSLSATAPSLAQAVVANPPAAKTKAPAKTPTKTSANRRTTDRHNGRSPRRHATA